MIGATRQLIRERGYHATALTDVLERSSAPRGSVYYHFPAGKAQMAAESAEVHTREQINEINRLAGASTSAEHLVGAYVDLAREGMVNSHYQRGCAIAPLVTEVGEAADELREAARRAFSAIVDGMAFQLVALGVSVADAREFAHAVVAAVEGALITSRALRSQEPFSAVDSG